MQAPYPVTPFDDSRHREAVIALWRSVFGYAEARNDPALVIDQKVAAADGLFFVAESPAGAGSVVGTVMCGYDGHRGWIYSLAVTPSERGNGIGRGLMQHAELALAERGCVKVNLQVLEGNRAVESFYQKLGYATEPRISMGKCLHEKPGG